MPEKQKKGKLRKKEAFYWDEQEEGFGWARREGISLLQKERFVVVEHPFEVQVRKEYILQGQGKTVQCWVLENENQALRRRTSRSCTTRSRRSRRGSHGRPKCGERRRNRGTRARLVRAQPRARDTSQECCTSGGAKSFERTTARERHEQGRLNIREGA